MDNFVGMQLTRTGFDTTRASDKEFTGNPDFPTLKIHATGTHIITPGQAASTIVTHGLGYYPFFMMFGNHIDFSNNPVATTSRWDGASPFRITTTTLECVGDIYSLTVPWQFRWYVFRMNLFEEVDYGNNSLTDTLQTDSDYNTLRISKDGKDANSTDYRDFVIHSSLRTLLPHKVKNYKQDDSLGVEYRFAHGLDYKPLFFTFAKLSTNNYAEAVAVADNPAIYESNTDVILSGNLAPALPDYLEFSFVLLKDPIL